MSISGMQTPDHNTINRFRSVYFKDILDEVFCELLDFLHEQGYIKFETYFVDGTKIEADVNKYSYVWKKNIQRYKGQLKEKVAEIIREIKCLNEENYDELDNLEINNYLKYNTFNTDILGKKTFHKDNMPCDKEKDYFICPAGKQLVFIKEDVQITEHGYQSKTRIYKSPSCKGCSFKEKCTKSKGNRTIHVRPELEEYKKQARDNLIPETGVAFRKKRVPEIETFFGDLKFNQGYRRFRLRGKEKAHLEQGWLCITYNLRKLFKIGQYKQKMSA